MVKFLIQRPIAVFMAFTACFIVAMTTYFSLPVSLLPDIAIPEITVQLSAKDKSARELENIAVTPVRRYLMQVNNLRDIRSETKDGTALIRLSFDFGTNTDLAFIEVNEKIDAAMNALPREISRPRVIKASATDLPVFYLNLTLKEESDGKMDMERYLTLCQFAESVIKRRIEQLPEVAMVDVTGVVEQQVQIVPDMEKLTSLGVTLQELESVLSDNNVEPGSMKVRDGYYEYNIKFSTLLRTVDDVRQIYMKKGDRLIQLGDIATVTVVPRKEKGVSLLNGQRAVTLSVIKQSDETIDHLKEAMGEVIKDFETSYPDIQFTITRSQTELLDVTIENLKQNLLLGFLLVCIVAFMFLGDVKSPLIIGISMIVSLVISVFFFYLFNMSLNIVSICGLILALGMMIDSSIVVTENISRYREMGLSLEDACDKGTTDVITPMLSSSLTTIAVFVPLVFMSGIAGAIFFDQAFAVTIGLLVSYFTGIMLLPVLYKLIYGLPPIRFPFIRTKHTLQTKKDWLEEWYHHGVDWVFEHKVISLLIIVVTLPLCVLMFYVLPTERMPQIDRSDLTVKVDWNENIHLGENEQRIHLLFDQIDSLTIEHSAYVGQQQYLLKREEELTTSESELYLRTSAPDRVKVLQEVIQQWMKKNYPHAVVTFTPPETVFEKIFITGEADIVAEFTPRNRSITPEADELRSLGTRLEQKTSVSPVTVAFDNQLNITIDQQKLLLYGVSYAEVQRVLRSAFKENEVTLLRSYQQQLPIMLAGRERTVNEVLAETLIAIPPKEKDDVIQYIPLRSLIAMTPAEGLKEITAGKNGEYIPYAFYEVNNPDKLMDEVRDEAKQNNWDVSFSGGYFSNKRMINELVVILLISILLMYFILAAQFESFMQPLIVLIEIPIDVAAALILLWLCGHTLNLMSAIGIVVTCGIIINDSILKIDVINTLRKEGVGLIDAIHLAGKMRLRAIIMTSLTTVFALVPTLFTSDIGSALQKPLAIAMIGAMGVGTLVSLFFIPLIYWFIYRRETKQ